MTNKGLDHLLNAQRAYRNGHAVFLFINADAFLKFEDKRSFALTPDHWVVLNSEIRIKKHNQHSNQLNPATVISQPLVNAIKGDIKAMTETAAEAAKMFGDTPEPVKTDDRVLLNAFTWGNQYSPVIGRIAQDQDARLSYFLSRFYGYISAKR
ncbi:hypothetical protein [Motiliproteus sp. MSK22-1]|uniref:hypothetical protein n=1 Tax=Motiliproteus sp. MSK22-1 TaxID=1897630 RepID=UPI00097817DD|nr:hypothetical protein [Motiliproteus sp. MSK22-1]OMH28016.1 hypothetical protein BGP75_21840 [Motiliproteus sp. MSK22-1]